MVQFARKFFDETKKDKNRKKKRGRLVVSAPTLDCAVWVVDSTTPLLGVIQDVLQEMAESVELVRLVVRNGDIESLLDFHHQFDGKASWWFVKKVMENPFACVKVMAIKDLENGFSEFLWRQRHRALFWQQYSIIPSLSNIE